MTSDSASKVRPPVVTLSEAVRIFVTPASSVYIGNFGSQLFCVGHEIIRSEVKDVDLIVASGGLLMDQLIGAGSLRSATFCHCWNPVGPWPAHNFRRAAESGDQDITFHEMSIGQLVAGLAAGAWAVPFMPVADVPGTGYVENDWTEGMLSRASCEFGVARVVKALVPDVAFVHVDRADSYGNGTILTPVGESVFAAQAAERVVLVAEEIVEALCPSAATIAISGALVDAVVCAPGAVAPDGAIGRYERDVEAYERLERASRTRSDFEGWLDMHVRHRAAEAD